jgi:hypothetical protein
MFMSRTSCHEIRNFWIFIPFAQRLLPPQNHLLRGQTPLEAVEVVWAGY